MDPLLAPIGSALGRLAAMLPQAHVRPVRASRTSRVSSEKFA